MEPSKEDINKPLIEPSKEDINKQLIEKWAEPDVLSRQQINQSMMDIQDIHPLRSLA